MRSHYYSSSRVHKGNPICPIQRHSSDLFLKVESGSALTWARILPLGFLKIALVLLSVDDAQGGQLCLVMLLRLLLVICKRHGSLLFAPLAELLEGLVEIELAA